MKIGTKVKSTRNEDFNGVTIPKGANGTVVAIPSHRRDMVSVKFDMFTTLFPITSLKIIVAS